jgi:hypothetical protein
MSLKVFERNIQSQFGEDGVIEEIFNRIGTTNKICVEFGAWDGIHLSNAWNLWHNEGWNALLIEGDKAKFELLVRNTKDFKNVHPILAYVAPEGNTSLESILNKEDFPKDLDLLSIDIDGDDYYIFESLINFIPRLILVEYNPTIPPGVEIIQKRGEYFGSSALSLLKLGHKKGYKLAHMTDTNLFLVKENLFSNLGIKEPFLEDAFVYNHLTYLISGYDGKSFLMGNPPYLNLDTLPSTYVFPELMSENVNINKVIINKMIFLEKGSIIKKFIRNIKKSIKLMTNFFYHINSF